jgi:hypothetical protein
LIEISPDIQVTYQQIATPFPVTYRDVVALRVRKKETHTINSATEHTTITEDVYFVFGVAINHRFLSFIISYHILFSYLTEVYNFSSQQHFELNAIFYFFCFVV